MRKVAKGFLVFICALLALAAVGMLVLNLYVQSAGTQARIEQEISAALRVPIHMSGTTISPWSGLRINGITIPQPVEKGNFLEATSFAAYFQFLPLFRRELIVNQVRINEPKIEWFQTDSGKWRMPAEDAADTEKPEATLPGEPKLAKEKSRRAKGEPFAVSVKEFQIKRGAFEFFDEKRIRVVAFSNVHVDCAPVSQENSRGTATSDQATVRDVVFLQELRAPFHFALDQLSLHDFSASIAAGNLVGDFTIQTAQRHSPFALDVKFYGIDLDRLLTEAGATSDQISGTLGGWLDLYGESGNQKTIGGSGHVSVTNGQMKQYDLFRFLGQALQIEELSQLVLQQAEADFRIGDARVDVDSIVLRSQNLKLSGSGSAKFDGPLKIDARLTVNDRIRRTLHPLIASNFQPGPDPGTHYVDFLINGTLKQPRTDFVDRMLGKKIQKQLGSVLDSLFGKKKADKKAKEKPEESPSPAASGSATPAPETAE